MKLMKRQPFHAMPQRPLFSQLSDEMSQFWDNDLPLFGKQWETFGGEWQPNVDIEQLEDKYLIKADVPGIDPKEIKVSMDNGFLIIEGKRESKVEENKENYSRIERNFGSFYRTFNLPDATDAKKIKAHCNNGVLEIIVPKSEQAQLKKIEVVVD